MTGDTHSMRIRYPDSTVKDLTRRKGVLCFDQNLNLKAESRPDKELHGCLAENSATFHHIYHYKNILGTENSCAALISLSLETSSARPIQQWFVPPWVASLYIFPFSTRPWSCDFLVVAYT